jgi:signal transduction histidine kinase
MDALLATVAVFLAVLAAQQARVARRCVAECRSARDELSRRDRLVHLATAELRGIALGLSAEAPEARPSLHRLLRLSDDLAAYGTVGSPRLSEERVLLGPLLDLVIGQISDELGRGRRCWRVVPALRGQALLADRRAMHQVLLRVLGSAVIATRDGDWIELGSRVDGEWWRLSIADEGTGLVSPHAPALGPESRGIGFGLSLARRLTEAHGGTLETLSVPGIGTRVELSLPVERLLATDAAAGPTADQTTRWAISAPAREAARP